VLLEKKTVGEVCTNLTSRNLNSPNSFKLLNRLHYRKQKWIAQFYYEHVS